MKLSKKKLRKKIDKISKILGISDYTFNLFFVPAKELEKDNDNSYANVLVHELTREVFVLLNKSLLEKRPEEIDPTLVHELLHVRFSEMLKLFELIIKLYVKDKKSKKAFTEQLDLIEHKIIVPLTSAILEKM